MERGMRIMNLVEVFFIHKRIILAVKRAPLSGGGKSQGETGSEYTNNAQSSYGKVQSQEIE
jgi:hypothetical protein